MKYFFLFILLISFLACTDSAPNPISDATTTPAAIALAPEETAPARFTAGTEICQLYSTNKAATLLGCSSDLNKKIDNQDNRYGCTFICTDPFVTFAISTVWTKDGKKQDVSRRDSNPALEKVSIPGADAAHFVEAQGRLMVAKGKYLMTVQLVPAEREVIFGVAEEILANL